MNSIFLLQLVQDLNVQLDITIIPLWYALSCLHRCKARNFLDMLDDTRHRIATRDHDKVYGLIGLAPPYIQKTILPDYRLDVAAVFAQPLVA